MDFEERGYDLTEGLPRGTEENYEHLGAASVTDEIQTEHLSQIEVWNVNIVLTCSVIYFQNSELMTNERMRHLLQIKAY
jgi:hypothetical protein